MVETARDAGAKVAVIYWPTQAEVAGGPAEPGRAILQKTAADDDVIFVDAAPFLAGQPDVYRDGLHPNAAGQKDLAQAVEAALDRLAADGN